MQKRTGACECGTVQIETRGEPLFRALCHCTICQAFNQAEYGDILAYRRADITTRGEDRVDFRVHKKPAMLQRGKCSRCGKPAIEILHVPLFPGLVLIPTAMMQASPAVSDPNFHIFYEHRRKDAMDGLPKYSGYLPSEMKFTRALISGLLKRR